jgi:subtilisin family serine protease
MTELQELGVRGLSKYRWSHDIVVGRCPPGADPFDVSIRAGQSIAGLIHVQPRLLQPMAACGPVGEFDSWHLDAMGVQRAWAASTGEAVCVAVLDNWFDVEHEDLVAGIADSSAAVREDGSGRIRFARPLSRPPPQGEDDEWDHGTACAGLVGARRNGRGVVGVAPDCGLMLVGYERVPCVDQFVLGAMVAYAVSPDGGGRGADVISCSLGPSACGSDGDATDDGLLEIPLKDALDFAVEAGRGGLGCVIMWAAPNAVDRMERWPLAAHPDVLLIARSDPPNSSGPEYCGTAYRTDRLDFTACGIDVRTTRPAPEYYGERAANSFATPCAAGVAALSLGVGNAARRIAHSDIRRVLRETADQIRDGSGEPYVNGRTRACGFGRLNAARAVAAMGRNP